MAAILDWRDIIRCVCRGGMRACAYKFIFVVLYFYVGIEDESIIIDERYNLFSRIGFKIKYCEINWNEDEMFNTKH